MSQVTVFDFEAAPVRMVEIDGEPWFVGKDICGCLEVTNHRDALGRLDDDERRDCVGITDAIGRERDTTCISEPGVYRMVFTSRSEAAARFKRWLAHDVLPAIRKTGVYATPHTPPETINSMDLEDLRKAVAILEGWRRIYGKRAARELARTLPIPQIEWTLPDRDSDHHVASFADMVMHQDQARDTPSADIYAAYTAWCADMGRRPLSRTGFGLRLGAMGYGKRKTGGHVHYTGVRIDEAAEAP